MIPKLDLSRLGKFQVGNEKEVKNLVKKKKQKEKEYVYTEEVRLRSFGPRD